jgi:predicted dienelactone hydrolase
MLLSIQEKNGPFAERVDLDRVSAVGFSLGAYTALALAGATTSLSEFDKWLQAQKIISSGPREFPDAANHIPGLREASSTFRRSWDRHGENFRDERIKSFVAMAPPPPVRAFTEDSVRAISLPVTLIVGGSDTVSPTDECASWLAGLNPRFLLKDLGNDIGHYTFLGHPTARALNEDPELFEDAEGVNRDTVHRAAIAASLNALA